MELHEKLAMLRKNTDYTTRALGEKLGVSQSSVSLWEKGERKPDYENILNLAKLYGVSTDYLLGSDKNSNKSIENELNEFINELEMMTTYSRREIDALRNEINQKQNSLQLDMKYYSSLTTDYSNNTNTKDNLKIAELVNQKIEFGHLELEQLNIELKKANERLKETEFKKKNFHLEYKKMLWVENHNLENLNKIENKNFDKIDIQSEYELQMIILKYLGIYDVYKNTNIEMDELVVRLKDSVKNHFEWF